MDCYKIKKHFDHAWEISKEIIASDNMETDKRKFHHHKNLILIEVAYFVEINMVPSGKKNYRYFIGSKDDDNKIKPFSIVLPKTSTYVESYGS